jgi:proline iminopeptidase
MRISDTIFSLEQPLETLLFPEIKPFDEGFLKVSEIHQLWYAQYGNPQGSPIVVFHGGPGAGCSAIDMRFFDPNYYRIILFDQRGANKSKPCGVTEENTTDDLISDIEKLRELLAIQKWFIFGGSWGSTLAILYGESYPEKCLGFILRGVFLGRRHEVENTWYQMRFFYPEAWDKFHTFLPEHERDDLINGYYQRLMNPDPSIHYPATKAMVQYILSCSYLIPSQNTINEFLKNEAHALGLARLFTTYSKNHFFIEENRLLKHLSRIQHLPAQIIHGRYDLISKVKTAYELHQLWPGSELTIVQDAGHSAFEPGISKTLIEATEKMKSRDVF